MDLKKETLPTTAVALHT